MGLKTAGGNFQTIKNRIATLELDTTHLLGQGYLKGKTHNFSGSTPVPELMVEVSSAKYTHRIKKFIVDNKILPYKCRWCGISDWNGQPLVLHLDHIDGNRNNQSLGNLRLLCPNCHSQTETYTGRNTKGRQLFQKAQCENCGKELESRTGKLCKPCYNSIRKNTPVIIANQKEIDFAIKFGIRVTAKKFGVSHTTMRRRLLNANITLPKRNQWREFNKKD